MGGQVLCGAASILPGSGWRHAEAVVHSKCGGRQGVKLEIPVLIELAREFPHCGYFKEEVQPTLPRMLELSRQRPPVQSVFAGEGGKNLFYVMRLGLDGCMAGNAYADTFVQVWDLFQSGRAPQAQEIYSKILLMLGCEAYLPGTRQHILKKRGVFKTTLSRREEFSLSGEALREIDFHFAHFRLARILSILMLWPVASFAQRSVVVVRHVEKIGDSHDAALSPNGEAQARRLAHVLKALGVGAIYATQFKRTVQTAAPLASLLNFKLQTYEQTGVSEVVKTIRRKHRDEIVMVVGHRSTVPRLLQQFGAKKPPSLGSSEYDSLFILVAPSGPSPTLLHLRF